jgi:hypothetical protein
LREAWGACGHECEASGCGNRCGVSETHSFLPEFDGMERRVYVRME